MGTSIPPFGATLTLPFPALHLGSFQDLSSDAFPSASSPTRLPVVSSTGPRCSESPTRRDNVRRPGSSRLPQSNRPFGNGGPSQGRPSSSPSHTRPDYPSSPPPNIALPPLPSISPLSMRIPNALPHLPVPPTMSRPYSPSSPPASSASLKARSNLTIDIPRTLTPPQSDVNTDFQPIDHLSAILRTSPSLARRRTVVQASPVARQTSPVHISQVVDDTPEGKRHSSITHGSIIMPTASKPVTQTPSPPKNPTPEGSQRRSSVTLGSLTMPVARPTPGDPSADDFKPHRLEKKASTNDLKNSPTSPRRSLPRPPPLFRPTPQMPPPLGQISLNDPASSPKIPGNTWPPPTKGYTPATMDDPKSPDLPTIKSRHQTTKSASSMPAVAGLADAGPYPTPAGKRDPGSPNIGLGRPRVKLNKIVPPQEEVCIECMMRDRDLADVIVQGDDIWDRTSDAAWEELKAREDELLKTMDSFTSSSLPSLDHSTDSEDDRTSPPSTFHSSDDPERRRANQLRRQTRRELDFTIAMKVGWRGFKWEEGSKGEGLPKGFRGTMGGQLTEPGIKALMAKWPSASAHRAKNLQTYLYHQAILIREIRAQAELIGQYPAPGEVPVFPTSFTSDGQSVIEGRRSTSVSRGAKHARELSEHMRGAFNTTTSTPLTMRPSPSSPADLAKIGVETSPLRPRRDASQPSQATVASPNSRKSPGSPQTYDRILKAGDRWGGDEDMWPPMSPAESGLRPFSFAVRASATARGSSDGHGRKSFFGRWGGSVTSLFGGSQGGSGSMMDMHLGLDNDRQDQNRLNSYPRAVSMASPPRPSFFGRESRASSIHGEPGKESEQRHVSKSTSTSRLSQVMRTEPSDSDKKPGLKGLLKKMKPKHRKESSLSSRYAGYSPRVGDSPDLGPLAPPPPISYLVGGDQHGDRSGSSSSQLTDNSMPAAGLLRSNMPYGLRAVSAPQGGSSSGGSQSASPTSMYNRRECYADDLERRGSAMEMLSGAKVLLNGPEFEDPTVIPRGAQSAYLSTYPPSTLRPNKTASSFSNSSLAMPMVETPPPGVDGANVLFAAQAGTLMNGHQRQSSVDSANKFKTLPPLPPTGMASYDSLAAGFGDIHHPEYLSHRSSQPDPRFQQQYGYSQQPSSDYSNQVYQQYSQPRTSFDPTADRPTIRASEVNPRMTHSMYAQPSAVGSVGSFGVLPRKDGNDDGRSGKSKKGLKGLFGGGAKAGRVA